MELLAVSFMPEVRRQQEDLYGWGGEGSEPQFSNNDFQHL